MGTCRYLLTGVHQNLSSPEQPWFTVEVQHRRAWNSEVAMTEHVWLEFPSHNDNNTEESNIIYMKIADPPQGQGMPTRIATEVAKSNDLIPMIVNEVRNEEFTMVNYGDRVIVNTWFGLHLEYVAYNWALDIFIPECYTDMMEGLCGNYNSDHTDDLADRNGTVQTNVVTFGQSWQTDGSEESCEGGPDKFEECTDHDVIMDCGLLINETNIFASCLETKLPSQTFHDNCLFDYCLDRSMKCGILNQFAQSCFRELAGNMDSSSEICSWATETSCAPECGPNSVYTGCADACRDTRTCGNVNKIVDDCPKDKKFVSMCVCNDGFVLENGECIPIESCGCITPMGAYVSNGYSHNDCDKECTCSDGDYECFDHPEESCISECGCEERKF